MNIAFTARHSVITPLIAVCRASVALILALSTAGASSSNVGAGAALRADSVRENRSAMLRIHRHPDACSTGSAKGRCKVSDAKSPLALQQRGGGLSHANAVSLPTNAVTKRTGMLLAHLETQVFSLRFKPNDELLRDTDTLELAKRTTELMHDYKIGARLTIVALMDSSDGDPATTCDETKLAPKADGCGFSCDGRLRALVIRRACNVRSFFNSRSRDRFWSRISTAIGPTPTATPARRSGADSQPVAQAAVAKPRAEPSAASRDGSLMRFRLRIMDPLL
jgi:hypothetical protein